MLAVDCAASSDLLPAPADAADFGSTLPNMISLSDKFANLCDSALMKVTIR